jgi:hypothetical protein
MVTVPRLFGNATRSAAAVPLSFGVFPFCAGSGDDGNLACVTDEKRASILCCNHISILYGKCQTQIDFLASLGDTMLKSDFYYDLPQNLIAQTPAEPRDSSRLLTLDRRTGTMCHRHFFVLPSFSVPETCSCQRFARAAGRLLGVSE